MDGKRCTKCGEVKPIEDFNKDKTKKDGLYPACKPCRKALYCERLKKDPMYRERETTRLREYQRNRYKDSEYREKMNAQACRRYREYRKDPVYLARASENTRRCHHNRYATDPVYREKYKARQRDRWKGPANEAAKARKTVRMRARHHERMREPEYRLRINLRQRCKNAIINGYKAESTLALLGCTWQHAPEHIEAQFIDGMTWDNYGEYWQLDHIIPCAAYDLREPAEQYRCFNFRNLRPLEATANISKKDKLDLDLVKQHGIEDLLPA